MIDNAKHNVKFLEIDSPVLERSITNLLLNFRRLGSRFSKSARVGDNSGTVGRRSESIVRPFPVLTQLLQLTARLIEIGSGLGEAESQQRVAAIACEKGRPGNRRDLRFLQ